MAVEATAFMTNSNAMGPAVSGAIKDSDTKTVLNSNVDLNYKLFLHFGYIAPYSPTDYK